MPKTPVNEQENFNSFIPSGQYNPNSKQEFTWSFQLHNYPTRQPAPSGYFQPIHDELDSSSWSEDSYYGYDNLSDDSIYSDDFDYYGGIEFNNADEARESASESGLLTDVEYYNTHRLNHVEPRLPQSILNSEIRAFSHEHLKAVKKVNKPEKMTQEQLAAQYQAVKMTFNQLYEQIQGLKEAYIASKAQHQSTINSVASRLTFGFIDNTKVNPQRLEKIEQLMSLASEVKDELIDVEDGLIDDDSYDNLILDYQGYTAILEGAVISVCKEIKDTYDKSWFSSNPTGSKLYELLTKCKEGKSEDYINRAMNLYQVFNDKNSLDIEIGNNGVMYTLNV